MGDELLNGRPLAVGCGEGDPRVVCVQLARLPKRCVLGKPSRHTSFQKGRYMKILLLFFALFGDIFLLPFTESICEPVEYNFIE